MTEFRKTLLDIGEALLLTRLALARDERNASHPVYPPRPNEGVNLDQLEQLRLRVMARFEKTLAYLAKL